MKAGQQHFLTEVGPDKLRCAHDRERPNRRFNTLEYPHELPCLKREPKMDTYIDCSLLSRAEAQRDTKAEHADQVHEFVF